jgi:hypothetical protein
MADSTLDTARGADSVKSHCGANLNGVKFQTLRFLEMDEAIYTARTSSKNRPTIDC